MQILKDIVNLFLHIDKHLAQIIQNFGSGTYILLFVIIFAETGFVVTPFLPGDSLLFAAGTFSALNSLNIFWIFILIFIAAVAGDSVNYAIGKYFGLRLFQKENSRFFKKEYLDRTHKFYEKYGGKTIVLARFIPIIRTFAPFVAGIGKMNYFYFFTYNVVGALLWVGIFVLGGYYFGNIPLVKNNFSIVIFIIIFLSILPPIIEYYKHKRKK